MALSSPEYHSSDISRFCDEHLAKDFHCVDIDHTIVTTEEGLAGTRSIPTLYARETRILRLIESKKPLEDIRRSQHEVLPLLARCVELGINDGVINEGSGVFVVTGLFPYEEGAQISRVKYGTFEHTQTRPRQATREELCDFLRCRLSLHELASAANDLRAAA